MSDDDLELREEEIHEIRTNFQASLEKEKNLFTQFEPDVTNRSEKFLVCPGGLGYVLIS